MKTNEQLAQLVQSIIDRLGVLGTVTVEETEGGFRVAIETDDSALLIGRGGETLDAFQTITRLLAMQLGLGEVRIHVDVNGYRLRKEEELVQFIRETAQRVKDTGISETLRPMTAYERRLAHQAVDEVRGLTSESSGEGLERRVVIRPL